jgi:hypothetical protein
LLILRLHIPDNGLPTISYVDVLDTHVLIAAVTQAAKGLDLSRMGPEQSTGGRRKRRHPALASPAAPKSRQNRHGRRVRARHLDRNRRFDLVLGAAASIIA